jgi:hypothetical protein
MEPTPEYLQLCETPKVKLCTLAAETKRIGLFLSMGRYGNKFLFSEQLKKAMQESLRKIKIIGETQEDQLIRKLVDACMILGTAKPNKSEGYEISTHLYKKFVSIVASDDIRPYMPSGPIYEETRKELRDAQGTPLPENNK